jgi:transcriptional regulator with XRE-family HTH domain
MSKKAPPLLPQLQALLRGAGESIRLARLRRRLTAEMVAKRADISRPTLIEIESGQPGVSVGAFIRVLNALGLEKDFSKIAADDELGRKLQDADLPIRRRAPRFRR